MKTLTRSLIAATVTLIALGTAATAEAKNPRNILNQVANAYQNQGNRTFQANRNFGNVKGNFQNKFQGNFQGGQSGGRHHDGGYVSPPSCQRPPCHDRIVLPPPPVCYVYIVYYYDCHCGWKTYGTYHNHHQAENAVHMLQNRGYRAYLNQVRR